MHVDAGAGPAPLVGIVMGSTSDWGVMETATKRLNDFGVPYEARVISAHRTPDLADAYASGAESRGLKCIIAGVITSYSIHYTKLYEVAFDAGYSGNPLVNAMCVVITSYSIHYTKLYDRAETSSSGSTGLQ